MKRVIIVCEGQTEQSFCKELLQPYFNNSSIYLENPTIKKTMGGIVNWQALKHQIELHLLQDTSAIVTTFIDYYGIYKHHRYPFWDEAEKINDKNERVSKIEQAMKSDVEKSISNRFIPYIQLHEFECFIFSDETIFEKRFDNKELLNLQYLKKTCVEYATPELINQGNETAPSKRLTKHISGYQKTIDGIEMTKQIGLNRIIETCPRFKNWISTIENI